MKRLGEAGVPAVQPLLHHADAVVRRRVQDVLESLDADPLAVLGVIPDQGVRAVVAELLAAGRLLPAGLPRLSVLLTTAGKRHTPNPTLVAVFGLHVRGASRQEIVWRLSLSDAAVRNYINHIYKVFGLPDVPREREQRRERLRILAWQQGFIAAAPKI